jgi:hypothetical protein
MGVLTASLIAAVLGVVILLTGSTRRTAEAGTSTID